MNRKKLYLICILLAAAAFLVQYEQFLVYGNWFDIGQWLHHESFSWGLVCISFGVFFTLYYSKKQRRARK